MKDSIIISIGLSILGICIIISSIIFSNRSTIRDCYIHGSLDTGQKANTETQTEYMAIGNISRLLGYDNIDVFTEDVLKGKIGDLPYVNVNGKLIFSKTAFEEWLMESARSKLTIKKH